MQMCDEHVQPQKMEKYGILNIYQKNKTNKVGRRIQGA